jgi:prefoldin subunit 5
MFDQINKELEELQEGIYQCDKIDSMMTNYRSLLSELQDKERLYKKELDKEQLDVENFNKTNITTIFYTILGSKDVQIEKERQEVLAAQLKYDDVVKQIEDIQYQIRKLKEDRSKVFDCKRNYDVLYQKKYEMLKESNGRNADKIAEYEKGVSFCKSNMKEIKEAISAGNRVVDALEQTESSLNSAEGWGVWDMFGGGLVTDMIKHSHIDDAKNSASNVQSLLNDFRVELADVQIQSQINIEIEGFVKFADFFFDGLISDWVVQSRINNSLESVRNVKNEVSSIINKLQNMLNQATNKHSQLERELSDIIKNA